MWPLSRLGPVVPKRARRPPAASREMLSFIAVNFTDFNDTDMFGNYTFVNRTVADFFAFELASTMNIYYTPLLISLGSIGNLLSVFVFFSSKLHQQSTSQYLSVLAISDTIFLMQLLPPWFNAVQFNGLFHEYGFCQLFVYTSYVTSCLSAWLVVAFTVERFVAVLYPLRRNVVCTVSRSRYIIYSLVIASLVVNIPVLGFASPSEDDCNIDFEYLEHAARFNIIDTGISFAVPLAIIIVMNTWIMWGVYRLEQARQNLMKANRDPSSSQPRPARVPIQPRSQQRVTRMLLIVSSVFVLLNLPANMMRVLAYAYKINGDEYSGVWAACQQVSIMFFNTNFGINFILYCLSGQNFRRALRQTMPFMKSRVHRGTVVRGNASYQPARASSISTSFASNCTESTTNFTTADAGSTPNPRRRRGTQFITRWKFDNSGQRPRHPVIQHGREYEMTTFNTVAPIDKGYDRRCNARL